MCAGRRHTNGIESFWSMLKGAYVGTFQRISPKHLQRYIDEFCGRQNMWRLGTLDRMGTGSSGAGRKAAHLPGAGR